MSLNCNDSVVNITHISLPSPSSFVSRILSITTIVDLNHSISIPQNGQAGFSLNGNGIGSHGCSWSGPTMLENMSCGSSVNNILGYTGDVTYLYFDGNYTLTSISANNGFGVVSDPTLPVGCSGSCTTSLKVTIIFPQSTQTSVTLRINAA